MIVCNLAILVAAAAAASDDWPAFRGPAGMGTAEAKGLPERWGPTENIIWKKELPGPGASTPVIVGKRIFLTSYTGYGVPRQPAGTIEELKRQLVCLDAAKGAILWTKEVPARQPEEKKIRDDHGYASNTPAVDRERVYAFFGATGVFAFDHSGKQLWQADVGSKTSGWGSAASPIILDDMVIVNASVESESLVALDKRTGKERWRAGGIKESWNTPIVVSPPGGKKELVIAIAGKILGFDPAEGNQRWSCDTDIGWYMVPSLVAREGIVYCIGGRTGGSLAVRAGGMGDVTKTHRLWTGKKGSNVSSLLFHDGHLYWAHENNETVYCAEAKTGAIVYEERLSRAGQFYPSPVLADGKIYYLTRSGKVFVVAAQPTFKQLAANELGDRSAFNASPAVAGGRIYLRSDKFLYCIGSGR